MDDRFDFQGVPAVVGLALGALLGIVMVLAGAPALFALFMPLGYVVGAYAGRPKESPEGSR